MVVDITDPNVDNNHMANLASGIFAQLWQYDPNGAFTQLREKAIKNQKLKEELENKKLEKDK